MANNAKFIDYPIESLWHYGVKNWGKVDFDPMYLVYISCRYI